MPLIQAGRITNKQTTMHIVILIKIIVLVSLIFISVFVLCFCLQVHYLLFCLLLPVSNFISIRCKESF